MKHRRKVAWPTIVAAAPLMKSLPFGPPALLNGEDDKAYDELLMQVSSAVKPADTIEEIWVGDIVALTWEVLRYRRLKAALLEARAQEGLCQILERLMDDLDQADLLAARWATRDASAVKEVDGLLAKAGLTMDAVTAETLVIAFREIEQIDQMEMTAEYRRNSALREIARHRKSFASSLRSTTATVADAAFAVVPPAPALQGKGR
jgi:hypothetical protein